MGSGSQSCNPWLRARSLHARGAPRCTINLGSIPCARYSGGCIPQLSLSWTGFCTLHCVALLTLYAVYLCAHSGALHMYLITCAC